jgi:hypothetical protein
VAQWPRPLDERHCPPAVFELSPALTAHPVGAPPQRKNPTQVPVVAIEDKIEQNPDKALHLILSPVCTSCACLRPSERQAAFQNQRLQVLWAA